MQISQFFMQFFLNYTICINNLGFRSSFDNMKNYKDVDTLKRPVILVRFEYMVKNKNSTGVLREESTR